MTATSIKQFGLAPAKFMTQYGRTFMPKGVGTGAGVEDIAARHLTDMTVEILHFAHHLSPPKADLNIAALTLFKKMG